MGRTTHIWNRSWSGGYLVLIVTGVVLVIVSPHLSSSLCRNVVNLSQAGSPWFDLPTLWRERRWASAEPVPFAWPTHRHLSALQSMCQHLGYSQPTVLTGLRAMRSRDLATAEHIFSQLAARSASDNLARYALAAVRRLQGRDEEAIRLLAAVGDGVTAYSGLEEALAPDERVHVLTVFTERQPDQALLQAYLAVALSQVGRFAEAGDQALVAAEVADRTKSLAPSVPDWFGYAADYYSKVGDWESVIAARTRQLTYTMTDSFSSDLERNQALARILRERAKAYQELGDSAAAESDLKRAAELEQGLSE